MHPPKTVVFDLGKVLLDFDYAIACRQIAQMGHISSDQAKHFLDHSPLLYRYETGLITTEEFFTATCAATGYTGDSQAFANCFADIFAEIPSMVAMQRKLRGNGVPTYIFSNTNELAVQHIRRNFPFFSDFDGYVLSYEHKSMKPSPQIYEVVEALTALRGADILYIDDREENIHAGAARGWRVIHHLSPEQTIPAVRALGLPA